MTLPVSLFNLGLAVGTLPAAFVMRQVGRRRGYLLGTGFGKAAGLVAAWGIFAASFAIFCIGTFIAGFYAAYVQSYRFAATDAATGELKAKAISWVMIGGLIAAIMRPQLVIWTRDAVPGTPYVGSFFSQAALALMAVPVLLLLRTPKVAAAGKGRVDTGRPLMQILLMPRYMLAVAAGVVSYGLMVFVMTAAPIAMVGHGHSVNHAALGIQWHVLAMFAPSFVTGHLMARFRLADHQLADLSVCRADSCAPALAECPPRAGDAGEIGAEESIVKYQNNDCKITQSILSDNWRPGGCQKE